MLQQGHEGELCGWLKEMSLIRTVSNCPHSDCKGRSLAWHPARIVDKYNWSCPDCMRKQSIRENSFFFGIKCDLKMCLQLILGWCQRIPCEVTASYLGFCLHENFNISLIKLGVLLREIKERNTFEKRIHNRLEIFLYPEIMYNYNCIISYLSLVLRCEETCSSKDIRTM